MKMLATDRAPGAIGFCPRIDHSFPHVAFSALPPDRPVTALRKRVRPQISVQRGVPFPHQTGILALQIVKPRPRFLSRAVGTACSLNAAENLRRIFVPKLTLPPHALYAALRYGLRCKSAVSLPVPLGCKIRMGRCKICFSQNRLFSGAAGTPAAPHERGWGRFPGMAFAANPIKLPMGSGHDLPRGKTAVGRRMP